MIEFRDENIEDKSCTERINHLIKQYSLNKKETI